MKVSLVIPAYNEEERIKGTLEDYSNFFNEQKYDYEILVVANGCKDDTVPMIKEFQKTNEKIRLKDIPEAVGKGGALIEGFKIGSGDLIGFVDADNSSKPKAFSDLVKSIPNYDGIIASRHVKKAVITKKQPISRRIASRGFNLLVRALFRFPFRDTQCGCKLFKKDMLKKITPLLGVTNWAFDINLLYLMKKKGYIIKEVPTIWEESEGSHLRLKNTVPDMFLAVMRLRLVHSPLKFLVKIYDLIGDNLNGKR